MTRQELIEDFEKVVRKVMREELRDILTEAVEIASRPGAEVVAEAAAKTPQQHIDFPTPDWVVQLQSAQANAQHTVAESKHPEMGNSNAIMGLLGATAKGMTGADLSNYR